jgi:uncharacterized lipoprotein YddW (UPF0748 family)
VKQFMTRLILMWLTLVSCGSSIGYFNDDNIPQPKREFRAFWIVTLDNKDFPSRPNLHSEEQQTELTELIDYHHQKGMNAAIFQVRPSGDAFYKSPYEPWSEWLMGEQGKAPKPAYDPLAYAIEVCHDRNMELHAWLNPYRVAYHHEISDVSANRLLTQHPDWFVKYDNAIQFDPGIPEVRQHIIKVVMDVVHRYDIDGIHFDDYFYPYKKWGENFADDKTYQKYGQDFKNKDDWRRDNVNQLIETLHDSIQKVKSHVKFGISPIGVWRNKSKDYRGSASEVGQTCYDDLYADILKWMEKGWIDYVAPQLYWSIGHPRADYWTLSEWWANNSYRRHIYIGQAFYKIQNDTDKKWDNPTEILNQLKINRANDKILGSIFFRAKFLVQNPAKVTDLIYEKFYKFPALIPAMPWKDSTPPLTPQKFRSIRTKKRIILKWETPEPAQDGQVPSYYVIYRFEGEEKIDLNNTQKILTITKKNSYHELLLSKSNQPFTYVITSFDRLHNESEGASLTFGKK